MISDAWNGGRQLTCSNGGNFLTISGWNKPDSGNPQYFEMYRQSFAGSGIEICLGTTCIKDSGYANSTNYPICIGTSNSSGGSGNLQAPLWLGHSGNTNVAVFSDSLSTLSNFMNSIRNSGNFQRIYLLSLTFKPGEGYSAEFSFAK